MYLLEKDAQDTRIKTYADSLWWGVVSLKFLTYFYSFKQHHDY